jgi:hypothetical protein
LRFKTFDLLGMHVAGAYQADRELAQLSADDEATNSGRPFAVRPTAISRSSRWACFRSGAIRGLPRSSVSISAIETPCLRQCVRFRAVLRFAPAG